MCIATTTVGGIIASAIISASIASASTIQASLSQNRIHNFQEKQSIQQAKIAERNAAYERQEGIEDARQKKLKSIQNSGTLKARIASGNIAASSETTLNLMEDEKLSGEIDALKIIDSSEKRAQSYMDTAKNHYANAALSKYNKRNVLVQAGVKTSSNITKSLFKAFESK